MKRRFYPVLILVVAGGLGPPCLSADEEPPVPSLARNGVLSFTCPDPGRSYLVEWAPAPTGPWSSSWSDLCRIEPGTATSAAVAVPMFYRVRTSAVVQTVALVTAAEAGSLIRAHETDPAFTVIDVRTLSEFHTGHIIGAVHIDCFGPTFEALLALLPRDRTYLVNCQGGSRSSDVVATMQALGFEAVYDLDGGFGAFRGIPAHEDLIE